MFIRLAMPKSDAVFPAQSSQHLNVFEAHPCGRVMRGQLERLIDWGDMEALLVRGAVEYATLGGPPVL